MKRLALTTTACALLLSACSGGTDTDSSETDQATNTQATTIANQETAQPAATSDTSNAGQLAETRARISTLRSEIDELDTQVRSRVGELEVATARINTLMIEPARQCITPADAEIPRDTAPEGGNADSAVNALASVNYLDSVLSQPCMFELPSGLILRIRRASEDGASPITGDFVTVHYRGTLSYGDEFDSSYSRGEPATFPQIA